MSGYLVLTFLLLLGAIAPVLAMGSLGGASARLIALEMGGANATLFFLLFTQASGQSYELILALVLAPLSVVGSLVFTRLLVERHSE